MRLQQIPTFQKVALTLAIAIALPFSLAQREVTAQDPPQQVNWQPPQNWEPVPPQRKEQGSFTIIWLSGTHYEMGLQQAELLGEEIQTGLGREALNTLDFFGRALGLSRLAMLRSYPGIVEECQGLSEGSEELGMTMDACMMLAFGDVYQEVFGNILPSILFHDGCSSFIVSQGATADGNLYHSHTLDNSFPMKHLLENPTLVIRQPTDGIPYVSVTAPGGVIPTQAMNAAGISISINSAHPENFEELSLQGTSNVQMMAEVMSRASSLSDAIAIFNEKERMRGNIITIADGNRGEGGVLEVLGFENQLRPLDDNGIVYASNHFVSEAFVGRDSPSNSSYSRFDRYQQLLEPDGKDSVFGTLNAEGAVTVLRDRINPETGEESPPDLFDDDISIGGNGPLRQVVFNPKTGLFWVASGVEPPVHAAPFTCFSLSQLLGFPDAISCPQPDIQ